MQTVRIEMSITSDVYNSESMDKLREALRLSAVQWIQATAAKTPIGAGNTAQMHPANLQVDGTFYLSNQLTGRSTFLIN